jgi:hypothetical protein
MQQILLKKFTTLGDPTLLLLAGLALFFYLWSSDERRVLARTWAVALGGCLLLTILSKLACYLLDGNSAGPLRIRSPSGHVAMATAFYGCSAIMLAVGRSLAARMLLYVGTAALLGALAASRIMLGLHTVPEIAIALAIGGFCVSLFAVDLTCSHPVTLNAGQVIALLLLIDVTHHSHVDGEGLIGHLVEKISYLPPQGADAAIEGTASNRSRLESNGLAPSISQVMSRLNMGSTELSETRRK